MILISQKTTGDALPTFIRDVCPIGLSFAQKTVEAAVAALGDDIRNWPDASPVTSKGGRPAGFDKTIYKRRNEVERTINALKNSRAVATRFDKRGYIFHGTVTVASIRLWLRP